MDIKAHKKMIDEQDARHIAQMKENLAKKIKKNLVFKDLQQQQMKDKLKKQEKMRQAADNENEKIKQQRHQENVDFEVYAKEMMKEWKDLGRDTRLLERTVDKLKEKPSHFKLSAPKFNTFERLGFTEKEV